MKYLNMEIESDFSVDRPAYVRSLNPGSQWVAHRHGEAMEWELDCPGLGHRDASLNRVVATLAINDRFPSSSGRYFHIPSLDSPLFYSLKAAAKWASEWEYNVDSNECDGLISNQEVA